MKTFLFYDLETSGLSPAFDQILTFACIRTDPSLNEIDRQTITVRLRKDIVPSPGAFLTHGLTYDELSRGINEYEAALKIFKIMNTPGTISLGYNSLGFDDEFLRFTFYRNLLDPYKHQYNNGCSRMDVLPIAVIFRVFYPACLRWPLLDGTPSMKLDLIASENNFITSGRAHEAMNDVEAVLSLSRKLSGQKDIWKYCLDFFNKNRDEVRINTIKEDFSVQNRRFRVCLMVSTAFGAKNNFMVPVVHIGQSLAYKNQSLWLRLDSSDILGLDAQSDIKDTFVIRKRAGDALIVLPAYERFWQKLSKTSRDLARENMAKLCMEWEFFFKFIQYHLEYKYPFIPEMDPDAALYQEGFFSMQEKKQGDLFHKMVSTQSPGFQKKGILDAIQSPRIKILASRILARNFGDKRGNSYETDDLLCLDKLRSSLEEDRIIGYRNDIKYNRMQGLKELEELEQTLTSPDAEQQKMLKWLKGYIETL